MVKVTSLLIKPERALGLSFRVKAQTSLVPRLLVGGEKKSLVSTVRACA